MSNGDYESSPATVSITVIPNGPPAPTNLTATTVNHDQIDLSWDDNATTETAYRVYVSSDGVTYDAPIVLSADAETYSKTGLDPGTIYYFKVTAYDGSNESLAAGPVSSATHTLANVTATPSSQNFNSKAVGSFTDATITYTNNGQTQATGFGTSGLAAPFDYKDTSYPGTGGSCGNSINPGESCTIVVTFNPTSVGPFNDILLGSYNNGDGTQNVDVTLDGVGFVPVPANAPVITSASATSATMIAVSWTDPNTDEQGYELEYSTDGGTTWNTPLSITPPNHNFTAVPSNSYLFRVKACNAGGCGTPSNVRGAGPYISNIQVTTGVHATQPMGYFFGGEELEINGSFFADTPIVSLWNNNSSVMCDSVIYVDPTQIRCTLPPAPFSGPYNVKVENPTDGEYFETLSGFTYVETEYGNGMDGDKSISGSLDPFTDTTVFGGRYFSARRRVIAITPTARNEITLDSSFGSSEFEVNDEILWIVMAASSNADCGSTSDLYRGAFGYARVTAVTGNKLVLDRMIIANDANNSNIGISDTTVAFCRIQAIRVPNFKTLNISAATTLTTSPYDFATGVGGVIAFKVSESITNSSLTIDVSASGFRGGNGSDTSTSNVFPGDSSAGPGTDHMGQASPNGSGGGAGVPGGAGGGGNGGAGGGGQNNGSAAGSIENCYSSPCLFMGGGGGGGFENSNPANTGGHGGGVAVFSARTINASVVVNANGGNGVNLIGNNPGGGAGGTLYIRSNNIMTGMILNAIGGNGGAGGTNPGGAGGGGEITVEYCGGVGIGSLQTDVSGGSVGYSAGSGGPAPVLSDNPGHAFCL